MKVAVYNQAGVKKNEREIKEKLFSLPFNPALLHEAVIKEQRNARIAGAKVKTRAAISGGGKKPWRQKGTGRARTGSIRNPIWRGGGVIFGPTGEQNFSCRFTRKKSRLAIITALISKKEDIIEIDKVNCQKTKEAGKMLNLIVGEKSVILIFSQPAKESLLAFSNLKGVKTIDYKNLSVCDILKHQKLIFVGDALDQTIGFLGENK